MSSGGVAGTARRRVPALDGLRGLSLAAVVVFHLGFGWARGGFLGVSAFFTLSGFFICSLLLDEHAATGRIDLRAFWGRRVRRLLPASLLAMVGVLVFGATVATTSQAAGVRADVAAALGYVANWRFVLAGHGYGDLFAAPSPAQHFWSLSIEEQCYAVFPLVVAGVLAATGGRRRRLGLVLAGGIVASVCTSLFLTRHGGVARAYFGTDTRAAELLVGSLLAVALHGRSRPAERHGRSWTVVGALAIGALLWSWRVERVADLRLYRGGLLLHAVAVALVIVAAHGQGPVVSLLSCRPLRWLGRISYAAYLAHWPLFLWLTPARTGLSLLPLSALRLAATAVVGTASTAWFEEPIRARRLVATHAPRLAVTAVAVVAVTTALAPVHRPAALVDYTAVAAPPLPPPDGGDVATAPALPSELIAHRVDPAAAPSTAATPPATVIEPTTTSTTAAGSVSAPPATPAPDVPAPVYRRLRPGERTRVYVAGDSVAFLLGMALRTWGVAKGTDVWAAGWFACPVARGGAYRYAGVPKDAQDKCNQWATIRATDLQNIRPHVVVLSYGVFDVLDRKLSDATGWQHLGEPAWDDYERSEIAAITELMASQRSHVVWLTQPDVEIGVTEDGTRPSPPFPESDPRRIARFNELVREVVATHPQARILDLRSQLDLWPGGELDPVRRPDGIHPSPEAAAQLAAWLGPQLDWIAASPT